ncbi:tetratricopeptide repeat (TPR)-like superfamily protein [Actinidia rufa]|uniref:Tetratricopeptide repeat (TPR)-like superfamily protein n=1 Tax=Actinidia rufa TaxID=165716 RepID=A0A7J0FZ54_9ERIC|nr:tetratricopeptide repeat (TPR)-like superfamily protein [Actinidia rufa]
MYSIQPQLEHYGAMVDLLGQAGRLAEAYAIINGIPTEPDVVIWRAFLSVIHQFKAGDLSHLERGAVYKVLEGLIWRTKMKGFIPTKELVLMDVSDEEKEENLNYHSEKLTLAYGILKTSPCTKIQITKNLRTCLDCHCWIKVVSRIVNWVIVVRNHIRFHWFEGGSCTCGDYW